MCVSVTKKQVCLIVVGPIQLLNLMTIPMYFLSGRDLCDGFSTLINISQDARSDKLAVMGNGYSIRFKAF